MKEARTGAMDPIGHYLRAWVALEDIEGEVWALTPEMLESGIYDLIRELMYFKNKAGDGPRTA
jgi:hypothetical protein